MIKTTIEKNIQEELKFIQDSLKDELYALKVDLDIVDRRLKNNKYLHMTISQNALKIDMLIAQLSVLRKVAASEEQITLDGNGGSKN